jgi:hypothetical protein
MEPAHWHPALYRHIDELRREAKAVLAWRSAHKKYSKLRESRERSDLSSDAARWASIERSGQRLLDLQGPRAFRVTVQTLERALAITNTIVHAGQVRGFSLRDDVEEGRIALVGHATAIQFRIREKLDTRLRKSSWSKEQHETYKVPTGRLRLTISRGRREGPFFQDDKRVRVESRLNNFFEAVYREVVNEWRSARSEAVRSRQLQELEQKVLHRKRIRAARKREEDEERARRYELKLESQHWAKAERIRSYIEHLRRRIDASRPEIEVWISWALRVADDLDRTAERQGKLSALITRGDVQTP